MEDSDPKNLIKIIDFIIRTAALLIGLVWAWIQFKEYREFKHWIQFDIDANIYKLNNPEMAESIIWNDKGQTKPPQLKNHTHAVEILLTFTNKGKTRFKIFNVQAGINTMRAINAAEFDKEDGHLKLTRSYTSGNLVKKTSVGKKDINETSFYYIEPQVTQTVTHLCLISEPRELLQVVASFNMQQKRVYPKDNRQPEHTVARTYQL